MDSELEICSCEHILDCPPICPKRKKPSIDAAIKAAALRVSPSVVSVITHNVPADMIYRTIDGRQVVPFEIKEIYACPGSGIIIQCDDAEDGTYLSTILVAANIFNRTNALNPHEIEVDVRVHGGTLYKGCLLACDVYYNIAAVTIRSDSPLQPATLRHFKVESIDVDPQSHGERSSQPRRHSELNRSFKVGTIMTARRMWVDPYDIKVMTGTLSTRAKLEMGCKELFSINSKEIEGSIRNRNRKFFSESAIINKKGEVIGIFFSNASFLPSNFVSRWWDHYKSCRQFLRPCVDVNVANRQFVRGVVVTKVERNSPAHELGLKRGDVIIGCDGTSIGSKLEFFERVWDNAGRVVKLTVLKAGDGDQLKEVNMTIGDAAPDNLYKWGIPQCYKLRH